MTEEEFKATELLRQAGYAVCVFTPEELEGVNPKYVEEAMCSYGYIAIESLKGNHE